MPWTVNGATLQFFPKNTMLKLLLEIREASKQSNSKSYIPNDKFVKNIVTALKAERDSVEACRQKIRLLFQSATKQ
jgi:hypothetical protein